MDPWTLKNVQCTVQVPGTNKKMSLTEIDMYSKLAPIVDVQVCIDVKLLQYTRTGSPSTDLVTYVVMNLRRKAQRHELLTYEDLLTLYDLYDFGLIRDWELEGYCNELNYFQMQTLCGISPGRSKSWNPYTTFSVRTPL